MRRVRSKGKKLSAANHDDPTSDEEKIPTQKRRGRPQKTIKDEIEEEAEKAAEDEDSEETANGGAKNKGSVAKHNGKKRKNNNGDAKEEVVEYTKGENLGKIAGDENEEKSKQTRHRRKGKPCRAPEAVVECT